MRFRATLLLGLVSSLFFPFPGFAGQHLEIHFDGFGDVNGNGMIDCSETVFFRITLDQNSAGPVPETGFITVPMDPPAVRWRYNEASIEPDLAVIDDCTWSVVDGNDLNDAAAVLAYSCDPRATDPLDGTYLFQFRVSGLYIGGTVGPIVVSALNERTSPMPESFWWAEPNAGPLNPCPPPPDLRLTKTLLSGDGTAGSTLVYNLSVTNAGNGGATGVVLQETVPQLTSFSAGSSSAGWVCTPNGNAGSSCTLNLGNVGSGVTVSRTFAVQVASSIPPGSPATIDNTACASSDSPDDPPQDNCGTTSTPAGNPDLATVKSLASGNGNPGSTLVYSLVVSNSGNRAAAGVQLADTVPALSTFLPGSSSPGWSCSPGSSAGSTCTLSVGTVGAGASASATFAVQLAATFPSNPPSIDNTACASTTTGGDPPGNNCGSVSSPPGGNPDLRTTKSVVSGTGDPGSTLVYSIAVANLGNRDAAGVQLSDTVPALATFLPASSSPGWSCSPGSSAGSTCTLSVGTVAAGTSASATFAVQLAATFPPNPPSIDNTACASTSTAGDPAANNCGGVSTPPGGNPDLRTTKSVVSGSGDPGATLVFSIVVANIGNRDAAGVQLNDTVPELATFLPASSSPGWSCSPGIFSGSICSLSLGTVAAGTSATSTFAVQLASTFPSDPPPIDNTACALTSTGGDPAADNCGHVSTPPGGNPDLQTMKSVASGNGNPGSTLIYSLVVSNLGNRDAAGAQLTETVPALSTFLPGTSSPGWTCSPSDSAGSTCILSLGTVAAGGSASRTFAVQLAAAYPPNPPAIENTACSSSSAGGDPAANDCGNTTTPPGGNPDLQMAKSVASGNGNPGSVLVYALDVTNAGTQGAAGVSLQETVPQLTTFLPGSSSPGWTCTPDGNAGSSCTLAVGTVAAGSSATFTFAVQVASVFPPDPPAIENSACVSTTSSGDPSGNDCGNTSTPPGGNPDLLVTKSVASGDGNPGSVLVYALKVSNVGTQGAVGVSLQETVPQLTTFLPAASSPGWICAPPEGGAGSVCTLDVGTVAAGSSATFTFAVQVASTFPADPPPIENSACASTTSGGDPSGNDCGTTTTPPGGNPDLTVTKTVASGDASPGSVLVYQLVVSNIGSQGAAGVSLEETVPQLTSFLPASSSPGWTCAPDGNPGSSCTLFVGTVPAGSSVSHTFAVQVANVFPPNPPPIENSACVSTTSGGDPQDNDCGSTSTPPGGNPDVRMVKSVASGSGSPGSVLVYALEVANVGTQGAPGVSIEETVPQLTSFLPASSSPGWTCTPDGNAGSSCTLPVGSVAAGSSVTFTFAVQVANAFPPDPPQIENSACVSTTSGGDPQDNDCGSTSTPPGGNADVRMVKSVASGSASPGSVLVYALEVSNIGNLDAAGVSLEETVPQLTSFLPASSSPGWACTPDGNAGGSCTLTVGTVPAGSSTTYTFAVQVVDEFPPNPPPIENSACVRTTSGGNPEDNDCDGTSTPPGGSPELTLSKALTSGTVVPNGVLVFTLTLDNSGTREATGVVLQETVPASSVFEAASSSPGWLCAGEGAAGTACTLAVGTVAAGASASFTFAVRLPPDLAPGTQVANTACVEEAGDETDPDGTNCRTVIIDPPGPETETDLEVTLTVDETLRQPGVSFTFTLTVHNASAVPAQGLRLSVSLPSFGTEPTELDPACQSPGGAVLECSVAELAGGASASFIWRQPAFQTGDYTLSAELMEATPEDVDSVPGNGVKTEDDYAEVTVVVSAEPEVHDIPTLSTVGLTAMVLLLVALGVVAMRRGAYRSAPGA